MKDNKIGNVFQTHMIELSKTVAHSAIVEANSDVKDGLSRGSKRPLYFKTTPKMKLTIAKYASENGIVSNN